MYSISEVAKKLGVSRQSVYNRLDKTELKEYIHTTDKGKMISPEGVDILKSLYPVKPDSQETVNGQSEDSQQTAIGQDSDRYVKSIEEQMEYLKGVILEKDRQLSASQEQTANLTRLLENSQVLQKQQQDKIFLLEAPQDKPVNEKKSIWDIFKRN